MIHEDITHAIIGAGMSVSSELRPGLDEKIYEHALVIELGLRGISCDSQMRFPVFYKGHEIGILIPDLVVEGKVIVDTKVVTAFSDEHTAQILGYLAITNLEVGLLLNFKSNQLTWKRIVRSEPR